MLKNDDDDDYDDDDYCYYYCYYYYYYHNFYYYLNELITIWGSPGPFVNSKPKRKFKNRVFLKVTLLRTMVTCDVNKIIIVFPSIRMNWSKDKCGSVL